MSRRPLVLVGPSGSGKTTLSHLLLKAHPEDFVFSVSATTRTPRGEEKDGVDYRFVTRDTFQQMIDQGEMAEWAEVHGQLYGTPVASLDPSLTGGRTPILDIDVKGALAVRDQVPGTDPIFILPPDAKVWVDRLLGRGTEDREQVVRRMETALDELESASLFQRFVVNVDLEETLSDIMDLHQGRGGVGISSLRAEALCEELAQGARQTLRRFTQQDHE